MSEEQAPEAPKPTEQQKELDTLHREYVNLCTQAGEKQYHINIQKKELARLNIQLRRVNRRAKKLMEAEAAAK